MLTHLVRYLFEQKQTTATQLWLNIMGERLQVGMRDDDLRIEIDGKVVVWTPGRLYKILRREGDIWVLWELVSCYPTIDADRALREILIKHGVHLEKVPFYLTKDGRLRADSEWSGKGDLENLRLDEEIGEATIDSSGLSVLINQEFTRETLLGLLAKHMEDAVAFENGGVRSKS